jgi:hypothetical protein
MACASFKLVRRSLDVANTWDDAIVQDAFDARARQSRRRVGPSAREALGERPKAVSDRAQVGTEAAEDRCASARTLGSHPTFMRPST